MSRTVDERVVEMRFDNRRFEENVRTTMSTLDKLKQKLNFSGASKGLENIHTVARNVDVSGLSGAVETVQAKFSGLEVIAVTALANITNTAVNAGKQMISAFTIEPVYTGFQEYELKMDSVQTIMASTGASLEEVNGYLAELNTYSDKTIYSFSDMTNNIGKFTNAGVKLEDAVAAIKGVSNEAAVSGANANEASRAMYNFAQALSAGAVKLIDWKSIENANMATVEFKNELLKTALAVGTVVEEEGKYKTTTVDLNGKVSDLFDATSNFNDSLSHQWMTTDVLIQTLGRYADETTEIGKKAYASAQDVKTFSMMMDTLKEAAQSGWATTWELLIGDFNEAKTIFTDLSEVFGDMIESSADARNNLLKGALGAKEVDSSAWEKFVSDVGGSSKALEDALKETARSHDIAIDSMIEKEGSFKETLKEGWLTTNIITETLEKFTDGVGEATMGLEDLEKIANSVIRGNYGNGEARIKALTEAGYDYATVQGYVNHVMLGTEFNLDQLSDAQLRNAGYTDEQIAALRELAVSAEEAGTPLNELMQNMQKPTGRELLIESFKNTFQALTKVIGAVKKAYRDIFPAITSMQLYNTIEGINKFTKGLIISDKTAKNVRRTFRGFFAVVDIGHQIISTLVKGFADLAGFVLPAGDGILGITAGIGDFLVKIDKAVKSSNLFNKGLEILEKFLSPLGGMLKTCSSAVTGTAIKFLDWANKNDILSKSIRGLCEGVKAGSRFIKVLFDTFWELPVVQNGLEKFGDKIKDVSGDLKEYFTGGIEAISAFVKRVKSMDSITLGNVKEILKDFRDNVLGYFIDIDSVFGRFKGVFGKFAGSIRGNFSFEDIINSAAQFKSNLASSFNGAVDVIVNIGKKIVSALSFVKDGITDNFWAIMTVIVGIGLLSALKKIGSALEAVKGPLDAFTGVLGGVEKSLNAYSAKIKAEAIYTIAKSIAVLAGSIAVLCMLDPTKVWSSVAALTVISGVLLGFSILMNKFGGDKKVSFPILSIAAALFILVTALKKMEELDGSLIVRNLVVLGILGGGLVAFATVLSIIAPKLSSGGFFLLAFSISLHILVDTLKDLENIHLENLGQTITILLGALAGLALIAKICKNVKAGSALTILAAVIALKLLVGVFDDIADIDGGAIVKGLAVITTIFTMFSLLMASTMLAGQNAAKGGVGILAMSVGIVLIVHAIKQIADMDAASLDMAMNAITRLMVVFAGVVMVSKYAGKNAAKAGVMLLMMSGACLILAVVMMLLSHLDPSGLGMALSAVVALGVVFRALIKVTEHAKECKSTLLILSATIAILVIAIATLSMIDPVALATASASLSAVIGTFALLVKSTSVGKKAKKALPSVAAMVLLVGALAGILYLLAALEVGSTLEVAASISFLMLSLSASMLLISRAGNISKNALISMAALTLVVAALGGILALLSQLNIGPSLETAASISLLLLGLSASCVILRFAGAGGSAAFVGLGVLAALVVGLGALLVGIGALAEHFPKMEEFLDKGIPILEKIGYALGSFFGNIIGGFLAGTMAGLPEIGKTLSEFMLNVTPFIIGAKMIDESSMSGVKALAQAIKLLTGAKLLEGLGSFLTGGKSFSEFGKEIAAFGDSFKDFANKVSGIENIDSVKKAANAAKVLAEFAKSVPNEGGALAWWVGENKLSTFGKELEAFAPSIKGYADKVSGLNTKDIKRSASAAKVLAEFAKSVPNEGGALAWWVGENKLSTFGKELEAFAPSIKGYADKVSGLNTKDIKKSANAASILSEFAKSVPNEGGALAWWVGENKLSTFGKELEAFAPSIKKYSEEVNGIETGSVKSSVNAASLIAEFASAVPNEGGALAWWVGENKLSTFGKELEAFAPSIKKYTEEVNGIEISSVDSSVNAGKALAGLADTIPKDGGALGWLMGESSLSAFGKELEAFAPSIKGYADKVSGMEVEPVMTSAEALKVIAGFAKCDDKALESFGQALYSFGTNFKSYYDSVSVIELSKLNSLVEETDKLASMAGSIKNGLGSFQTALSDIGKAQVSGFNIGVSSMSASVMKSGNDIVSRFTSAVSSKGKDVADAFSGLLNTALTAIRNKHQSFRLSGQDLINNLVNGISAKSSNISSGFLDSVRGAANAARNFYNDFYNAGVHVVNGFADGINANRYAAEARAAEMANAAADAARRALDEHSPSKVFYGVGDYAGVAFVNALGSYVSKSFKTGKKIAMSATDGLNSAISHITDIINGDADMQPTIRPVLDLTDIESGVGVIGGLFSGRQTLSVDVSSINAVSASMRRHQNEDRSGEVVSAIRALRRDLSDIPRNIYNVNGITYDDGTNVASAVKSLVRAARIERRV